MGAATARRSTQGSLVSFTQVDTGLARQTAGPLSTGVYSILSRKVVSAVLPGVTPGSCAAPYRMKVSDKIKAGKKIPGRNTWHGVDPRTKIVKPKKGKGSYQRSSMRGLERKETSDARDLLRDVLLTS